MKKPWPLFEKKPPVAGADVRIWDRKLWLSGVISTQEEAEELVAAIAALRPMLATPTPKEESK